MTSWWLFNVCDWKLMSSLNSKINRSWCNVLLNQTGIVPDIFLVELSILWITRTQLYFMKTVPFQYFNQFKFNCNCKSFFLLLPFYTVREVISFQRGAIFSKMLTFADLKYKLQGRKYVEILSRATTKSSKIASFRRWPRQDIKSRSASNSIESQCTWPTIYVDHMLL